MAGSRRHKIGSIFSRMTGLLRAGAYKEEDLPLWYAVVKAFPPKPIPPPKEIPNILYPEDFVRVNFFKTFAEQRATVLTGEKTRSIPQRFVDKYLELQDKKAVPTEQLFDETVRILKEEGIRLLTHEEKQAAVKAKFQGLSKRIPKDDLFSKSTVELTTGVARNQSQSTTPKKPVINIDDLFKEDK